MYNEFLSLCFRNNLLFTIHVHSQEFVTPCYCISTSVELYTDSVLLTKLCLKFVVQRFVRFQSAQIAKYSEHPCSYCYKL